MNAPIEWSRGRTLLVACIGSYFAVRFTQVIISPVIPGIIETFSVSRGAIGVSLTGMWVAYALSQLPSGIASDRVGERVVVLVALVLSALGTFALATAPVFFLFALCTVVVGIGAGLYYNPATTLLTREFDGVGGAIGLHKTGSPIAGVIAPIAAVAVGARYGWRVAVATGALLALVAAGSFLRVSNPTEPRAARTNAEPLALRTLTAPFSRLGVGYTTALASLCEFIGLATMSFLPIFLVERYGLGIGSASLLFSIFFAIMACSQPLAGWLSDRLGRDPVIAFLMGAGIVGYGVLSLGDTVRVAIVGVVLAGIAMSWIPPVQSRVLDRLSNTERGTGFGLFRTIYLLIGATGTTAVGLLADLASWSVAFGLLSVLSGIVLCSLVATRIVP